MEQREKDIQALCNAVLEVSLISGGNCPDYCPFCIKDAKWNECMNNMNHEPDCAYLIAKDLQTGIKTLPKG
ncbi:MAG: hypothetical protein WC622_17000 [Pedobacter sp.]|jgi:hypothetical protein|uniref:hypothetical protein n=1 Tax=Pedobacter sp. TaxID=1411316 RepID=UPI00356B1F34